MLTLARLFLGGGSGTQKFAYQKWPKRVFVFSHNGHFRLEGGAAPWPKRKIQLRRGHITWRRRLRGGRGAAHGPAADRRAGRSSSSAAWPRGCPAPA